MFEEKRIDVDLNLLGLRLNEVADERGKMAAVAVVVVVEMSDGLWDKKRDMVVCGGLWWWLVGGFLIDVIHFCLFVLFIFSPWFF